MHPSQLSRRVATMVPRVLDVHADSAQLETSAALSAAIERVAEMLLQWHDELNGTTPPMTAAPTGAAATKPAHITPTPDLAAQIRDRELAADTGALSAGAADLRGLAREVRRVLDALPGDAPNRARGAAIESALTHLGSAQQELADTLNDQEAALRAESAMPERILERIVHAEAVARAAAADTLRS